MADELQAATDEAKEAARGQAFIERLLERTGNAAGSQAAFGTPVTNGGVTVIPVARVRWGAGGGSGSGTGESDDRTRHGQGSGAGGGAGESVSPFGYIELRDGQARFVRFPNPSALVPLIVASTLATWVTLRGLRALLR